jgi:cysteine-rich secretory family protein
MRKLGLVVAFLAAFQFAEARGRRGSAPVQGSIPWTPAPGIQVASLGESTEALADINIGEATEALDEVNAVRAARGLPAFARDEGLTTAAQQIAAYRAKNLIQGHTNNDFSFLNGSPASAAGCAAWPSSYGWGSCCTYESWRVAGAAWCVGRDGRRYMHLFVR